MPRIRKTYQAKAEENQSGAIEVMLGIDAPKMHAGLIVNGRPIYRDDGIDSGNTLTLHPAEAEALATVLQTVLATGAPAHCDIPVYRYEA